MYAPAAVTGYTADVIANGVGPVASSTTATIDRGIPTVRWCFANTTFVNPSGVSPVRALPASGLILSLSTVGLTFQMAPATSNNSLRIDGAGTGTLTLTNPQPCSEVMVLATEGNGSTAPKTFVVTFTDGTTQLFNNIVVPDWFGGTITPAIIVGSRVSYVDNSVDNQANDPRIYEVRLSLAVANYSKLVQSVTVSKTSTDPVLNVMGISLGANCLGVPVGGTTVATAPSLCPGATLRLTLTGATTVGSLTYQWQSAPLGSTTFTDITGATAATYTTVVPAAATQYRARITCNLQSGTSAAATVTPAPTTSTLAYSVPPAPASFCRAGTQAVVTATPAGGTFTAPAGLVVNATTGLLDLAASTPGTYTVTYTLPAGACPPPATTTVTVTAPPVPTLTYQSTSFCRSLTTATPAATPVGGTYTGSTGLVINATTGVVNPSLTPAGTYTVSYTSPGICSATTTVPLTILAVPSATVAYPAAGFCQAVGATSPTVSPAGGTFSGSAGLLINATTGVVNLAQTPVGTYTVTYTSPAPCTAVTTTTLVVQPLQVAMLAFSAPSFCQTVGTTSPTASPAGGTFSGSAGLLINATTGVVNLAQTPVGTYAVMYTSPGPCSTTSTTPLTVLPLQQVALAFNGTEFCKTGAAPVPVVAPTGGAYRGSAGLVINASTGTIDLDATPNGTYTVTYTSLGPCPGQATATLTIKGNTAPTYPTVLTPNNDGKNDVLKLQISDVLNYRLQVFNRWGRRVYEGTNPAQGWDPSTNSGGTYYYLVEYNDCLGRPLRERNWIDVIK